MIQPQLFETPFLKISGQKRKEIGQKRVIANEGKEWLERALSELRTFCSIMKTRKETFAFEQFRAWAVEFSGMPEPFHHNAWGAVPAHAVRAGLIEFTGQYRPAKSARTHGHPVKVWRTV